MYFLSRVKEGLVFDWIASRLIDRKDRRNLGVSEDRIALTREGHRMRIIHYTDPEHWPFLRSYAEMLEQQTQEFDFGKLPQTLQRFPEIIASLS